MTFFSDLLNFHLSRQICHLQVNVLRYTQIILFFLKSHRFGMSFSSQILVYYNTVIFRDPHYPHPKLWGFKPPRIDAYARQSHSTKTPMV